MSDLLTQEEIDALLSGVDEFDSDEDSVQETAADEFQAESRIRTYDFSRREKIICGHMPILDNVNERFSGLFRKSLSNFLGNTVEIDRSAIQVQQFSEYTQGLPLQTHFTIVKFSPLRGCAVMAMDSCLVFTLIDHYFGGGAPLKNTAEKKQLSPVMIRVLQKILDLIFKDLKEAWKPVMEIDFDYFAPEINPAYANIAGPDEIIVISTIHIQLKGGGGNISIAMPYTMIEPVRNLLDNPSIGGAEDDRQWQIAFLQQILHAEISVAGQLAKKKMTIGEVMRFKKGDLIMTDKPEKVILSVQGVPVYEGKSGVSGGRNALRITGRIGT